MCKLTLTVKRNLANPLIMHRHFIVLLTLLTIFGLPHGHAVRDSTATHGLTRYMLPATLVTAGFIVNLPDIKRSVMDITPQTKTKADDYIQYLPIASLYLLDFSNVKSKNSTWDKTKFLALSLAATGVIVHTLKPTIREQRPNSNAFNSFPSGHTALAFTGAGVLYHEFKDRNKFIAYSGFVTATAVGVLRQTNRKHWASDVLAGAGIGMLTSTLIYHIEPLKNWQPFNSKVGFNAHISPTMISREGQHIFGFVFYCKM